MARVLLRRVEKRFGEVAAVRAFDLEVRDREFLVLVGPSGCGKTTTLRMVAGLEDVTSGQIYIGERLVNDVAPKDRDIAMVFQNYALYPHMNVYDNMAFGLKLRRVPRGEIDRRVKEAAEVLGIGGLLRRKPRELSGGQRQRVALGRAIVRDPQVFLMDEPLSNLDAKLRVQTRTELAKLHQRLQATVIYVTHDQTEAMTLGDRIVVMRDGEIQQVATPQELYENPANLFVAGFIGSPPMNFLRCRVVVEGERVELDGGSFRLRLSAAQGRHVAPYAGKEVVLGVRPEDLRLGGESDALTANGLADGAPEAQEGAAGANARAAGTIQARVDVLEPMGSEVYAYLSAGTHTLAARLEARAPVREGDRLRLQVPADRLRVFDPTTERAVA